MYSVNESEEETTKGYFFILVSITFTLFFSPRHVSREDLFLIVGNVLEVEFSRNNFLFHQAFHMIVQSYTANFHDELLSNELL